METFKFQNDAPILKYCQKALNICSFSSLESYFVSIEQIKAYNDISLRIEESLESEVVNRIDFSNTFLENEHIIKGEPKVHYSLVKYKKKGSYDILKNISENVTLVHLIGSLGNFSFAISVVGYWIFDSNYKKALVRNRKALYMICAPSVG